MYLYLNFQFIDEQQTVSKMKTNFSFKYLRLMAQYCRLKTPHLYNNHYRRVRIIYIYWLRAVLLI